MKEVNLPPITISAVDYGRLSWIATAGIHNHCYTVAEMVAYELEGPAPWLAGSKSMRAENMIPAARIGHDHWPTGARAFRKLAVDRIG